MRRALIAALVAVGCVCSPALGADGAGDPNAANNPDLYRPAPKPAEGLAKFAKRSPQIARITPEQAARGVFLTPPARRTGTAGRTRYGGRRTASTKSTQPPDLVVAAPLRVSAVATARATGAAGGGGARGLLLALGVPALLLAGMGVARHPRRTA